jgi:hypothetical protein
MKKLLDYDDSEFLIEEYKTFKATVSNYNKDTPYYVYTVITPVGDPFYIGKGKGMRG